MCSSGIFKAGTAVNSTFRISSISLFQTGSLCWQTSSNGKKACLNKCEALSSNPSNVKKKVYVKLDLFKVKYFQEKNNFSLVFKLTEI
jgi:hypothetical protein